MKMKYNRVGEEKFNRFGSRMTIVEYNSINDITVIFDNGYYAKATYQTFQKGNIKNPYDKSVYGVGYLGEGIYKSTIDRTKTKEYTAWEGMLKRCYSDSFQDGYNTYKGCQVHIEWHNFQNFAKWYSENYYTIGEEKMCLDKDILYKGNKIYSSSTCVFVPQAINSLFTKSNNSRKDLPIGVSFESDRNKYKSSCRNGFDKLTNLGRFNTPEEAFYAYKAFKEKTIKEVAERYKSQIPSKLYDALLSYEVEIDD